MPEELCEHHVVAGVLVRRRTVLLGHRRGDRAWYPDCWDLPGGHVEDGETARSALDRECREELGIGVLRTSPLPFRTQDAATCLSVFRVEAWAGEPTNLAPDEHDALAWWSASGLAGAVLADPAYRRLLTTVLARTEGS